MKIQKLPDNSFTKNGWREVFFKQVDYDQVNCKKNEKSLSTKIRRYGDKEDLEKNKELQDAYTQELKQDAIDLKQQIKQDSIDLKQCASKLNLNANKDSIDLNKCKVKKKKFKEVEVEVEEEQPICFNSNNCREIFKKNDLLNSKIFSLISKIGVTENNINETNYMIRKTKDFGISRNNVMICGFLLGISINFILLVASAFFGILVLGDAYLM